MPDSMDWVKAGVRSCDICSRETDAGEWPDWPDGICEDCDPDILFDYFDCDDCNTMMKMDDCLGMKLADEMLLLCFECFTTRNGE